MAKIRRDPKRGRARGTRTKVLRLRGRARDPTAKIPRAKVVGRDQEAKVPEVNQEERFKIFYPS